MRNILDRFVWIGLFVLVAPTALIIGSWNSLPGDYMFPVKLTMEQGFLAMVSPSYEVSGQVQIKYTERRFAEARKLLAVKNSVLGLPYLDKQMESAKTAIVRVPDLTTRTVLATKYIAKLTEVSGELEQQKKEITGSVAPAAGATGSSGAGGSNLPASESGQATPVPTGTGTATQPVLVSPSPTLTMKPKPVITPGSTVSPTTLPTPTPGPTLTTIVSTNTTATPPNIVIAMQITQTQQQISQTIQDLKDSTENNQNDKQDKNNQNQNDSDQVQNPSSPSPALNPKTQQKKD